MQILDNKYYIVRRGDFATCGNSKILYGFFSLLLCLEEYITTYSTSCIQILIGSTIVWSIIEFYLHLSNTRIIKPMYIEFTGNKWQLNKHVGIILQGFQEGGFITTIGMYFGDRLFMLNYMIMFHILIIIIIMHIVFNNSNSNSNSNGDNVKKASMRQINTTSSISLMSTVTIYNGITLYNNPSHIFRQLAMFFIMVYISSIWTIVAWYNNNRTVEIFVKNNYNEYNKKTVTNLDSFYVLSYDVIFEIGIAYMFFYNLCTPLNIYGE
jgi:hypothetical protein